MIEQVFYNGSLFLEHLKDAKMQSFLSDTCVNSYDVTVCKGNKSPLNQCSP